MNKNKSMTLKELNVFAKENGLSEDVKIFIFGEKKLLSITSISTECLAKDALYTDIYLEVEKEL